MALPEADCQVTVSRDQRSISHMVTRSLIAGHVCGYRYQNLDATSIRRSCGSATLSVAGGIHVRLHPDRPDYILIEFIDKN